MKKIGMVGGLSWQSTVDYYRIVNEESNNRLGNKSTVESIIFSTDLERKYNLVTSGQLDTLAEEFIDIAQSLERAGAWEIPRSNKSQKKPHSFFLFPFFPGTKRSGLQKM